MNKETILKYETKIVYVLIYLFMLASSIVDVHSIVSYVDSSILTVSGTTYTMNVITKLWIASLGLEMTLTTLFMLVGIEVLTDILGNNMRRIFMRYGIYVFATIIGVLIVVSITAYFSFQIGPSGFHINPHFIFNSRFLTMTNTASIISGIVIGVVFYTMKMINNVLKE